MPEPAPDPVRVAPPVTPSGGVPANVPPVPPRSEMTLPAAQLAEWVNPATIICDECGQPYGRFKVDPYTQRARHIMGCAPVGERADAVPDTPIPRTLHMDAPPAEPRVDLPRPESVG